MTNLDDQRFLDFPTYEDYLDSFITIHDIRYLRSTVFSRKIAELGYRSVSQTLTKDEFSIKRDAVKEFFFPSGKKFQLVSEGKNITDLFLKELASREKTNRLKSLSTIIFLRHYTKSGFEISGYIDYEKSLRKFASKAEDAINWDAIFLGKKRLWPKSTDLSYFHWRSGYSTYNDTENYKVILDPEHGLCFLHKNDRTIVCIDPLLSNPGSYTTKTVIFSENYNQIILYDHVVRNKV